MANPINKEIAELLKTLLELRTTNNIGAIALTDMLIETYQEKYGKLEDYKPYAEVDKLIPDKKVKAISEVLEKKMAVFTDQELFNIADQLLKLLKRSLKTT